MKNLRPRPTFHDMAKDGCARRLLVSCFCTCNQVHRHGGGEDQVKREVIRQIQFEKKKGGVGKVMQVFYLVGVETKFVGFINVPFSINTTFLFRLTRLGSKMARVFPLRLGGRQFKPLSSCSKYFF